MMTLNPVAPHAGAWVETLGAVANRGGSWVAPHAGAWVETALSLMNCSRSCRSRPMRARGLKLRHLDGVGGWLGRAPCGRVG